MPLYPPFVGQMSRQLDAVFVFYGNFCKSAQKDEEKEEGKYEETEPIFEISCLGNA